MSGNKDDQGRFLPGASGNPKGRPRRIPRWVAEFRRLEPKAMKFVKDVIEGEIAASTKDRMEAVKLALGYSRGKPRESVELSGKDGGAISIGTSVIGDDPERARRILEILAGVGSPPPEEL